MTGADVDRITTGIIIGVTVLLIVWDVVLTQWKDARTESRLLANWSRDWTIIPYAWGVLGGHWFWFWGAPVPDENIRVAFYIAISILILISDAILYYVRQEFLYLPPRWVQYMRHPLCMVIVGILVGHFLWGQRTLVPFPI